MQTLEKNERCCSKACRRPRKVAGYCMYCYVLKRGRRYRVHKLRWFVAKRQMLSRMLTIRYLAGSEGLDPGPVSKIIDLFVKKGGPRIRYTWGVEGLRVKQIRSIIKSVDKAAQREYERQNSL